MSFSFIYVLQIWILINKIKKDIFWGVLWLSIQQMTRIKQTDLIPSIYSPSLWSYHCISSDLTIGVTKAPLNSSIKALVNKAVVSNFQHQWPHKELNPELFDSNHTYKFVFLYSSEIKVQTFSIIDLKFNFERKR